MLTGTANFETTLYAYQYYKPYGCSREDVEYKILMSEISIGKPELKSGQKVYVNTEGRYVIEDES